MGCSRLTHQIQDDEYTLDLIEQEPVLVVSPLIVAEAGSDWEGSLLFNRDYLLALLTLGLECQLLSRADLGRAAAATHRQPQDGGRHPEPNSQALPAARRQRPH